MKESSVSVKEDGDQARFDVLQHKTYTLSFYIKRGTFGAVGAIGRKEISGSSRILDYAIYRAGVH